MDENEIKDKIRSWVENYPRSYFKKIKASRNKEILDYIEKNTPLLSDPKFLISTKVYWILNDMVDFPKCVVCGRKICKNVKATEGYPTHCSPKCLANDENVKRHKEEAFSRKYGEEITNPFQAEEVKKKISSKMLEKYGEISYTKTREYKERIATLKEETELKKIETMSRNDSFFGSKLEKIVRSILLRKFPDLKTQYRSEEYPFRCDFFIPSTSQYVEYNGTWTHGKHPFDPTDPDDIEVLEKWKGKNRKYYENAIETWTVRDVRKRKFAKERNINLIELWNISDVYRFVGTDFLGDLEIPFQRTRILEEFSMYRDSDPKYLQSGISKRNLIVKFFQQDIFFKKEREIWKNDAEKREFLIKNRERYLKKPFSEMTVFEILLGFKISGIHYGYSHFNPFWFKWFISKVGCEMVYDPFGGWGHRLLGGLSLKKYIYNDFSRETKDNVDRIVDYFRIKNTETHCENALGFVPESGFDSIFSCPPYFNIEKYPCGIFRDRNIYDETLRFVYNLYLKTDSCLSMGLVLREDLVLPEMKFDERFLLNFSSGNLSSSKKIGEYLYLFKKTS